VTGVQTCALPILNNIRDINRKSTEESVIALLFSPERILQEEAARLIARTKREIFSSVSARLPKDSLEIPCKIFSGDIDGKEFLMSKVIFLSSVFKVIPEDELLFLAGSLKYIKNITEIPTDLNPHYILWNSNTDFSQIRVYTITGEDPSEYEGYILSDNAFFYLLPLDVLEDFQTINPEQSFEIYNYLNDYEIKTSES
jgi:hypothetical protein